MVFDPAAAPRSPHAFREWYWEQTDWSDDDSVYNCSIAASAIQRWYRCMVELFPDSNQIKDNFQPIGAGYGDYNFTRHICYVSFRPQFANEAWALIRALAAEHRLGTYDPNSDDERSGYAIRFPDDSSSPFAPKRRGIFSFFSRKPR